MSQPDHFPYALSAHARERIGKRNIDLEWVRLTVSEPTLVKLHPNDSTCLQAYRVIPESDGKVLKVVYNATTDPWRIVTIHFDRSMRGKL
jgi:Domain of unknown function (DUF4258)